MIKYRVWPSFREIRKVDVPCIVRPRVEEEGFLKLEYFNTYQSAKEFLIGCIEDDITKRALELNALERDLEKVRELKE